MNRILFIRDHLHHSNQEMLAGIRRFAKSKCCRVILCQTPRSDFRQLNRLAEIHQANGIIVETTTFRENALPVARPRVPTVFINAPESFAGNNAAVVNHDSTGTGIRAAETMMALGLRKFLYAPYHTISEWNLNRESGFCSRLTQSGFSCRRYEPSPDFLKRLLLKHQEVGVFAANDEIAVSILSLAKKTGIDIPRQLVVLGVDDQPSAKKRSLSSIRVDFEMGGYLAAKTLHAILSGSPRKLKYLYGDLGVIHRRSTRHISISSPLLSQAIQLIRQKACDGLSVSDVAAIFPGSRRSAERYFRAATGSSIHEEIENIRQEKLLTLLADPSIPLGKVHHLAGYGTPQAMRKAFRLHHGTSMIEWRKRHKSSVTSHTHVIGGRTITKG